MSWEGDSAVRRFYDALGRADRAAARACLAAEVEWEEPDVPGYPLAGLHRGRTAAIDVLAAADLQADVEIVAGGPGRAVATGVLEVDGRLVPFAHVCVLAGGLIERVRSYPDTSAFASAVRDELAAIAEGLLEEATTLRRRWDELAEARGTELPSAAASDEGESDGYEMPLPPAERDGRRSARLDAVDMAAEGRSREEVLAYLAEHVDRDAAEAFVEEIFGPPTTDRDRRGVAGRLNWRRG